MQKVCATIADIFLKDTGHEEEYTCVIFENGKSRPIVCNVPRRDKCVRTRLIGPRAGVHDPVVPLFVDALAAPTVPGVAQIGV